MIRRLSCRLTAADQREAAFLYPSYRGSHPRLIATGTPSLHKAEPPNGFVFLKTTHNRLNTGRQYGGWGDGEAITLHGHAFYLV